MKPPLLDRRTRAEVLAQALRLAGADPAVPWAGYVPEWEVATDGREDDPGRRMLELFSRLAELLIDRVNGVPEKNFLAFLDLAGVERFPGAPAEVPVTFVVSRKAARGGVVPAATQVATVQTKVTKARVYETRRAFFATRAQLERVLALHPSADRFVDLGPALPPTVASLEAAAGIPVLGDGTVGMHDVEHILYVSSAALFSRTDAATVTVVMHLAGGSFPPDVVWRRFDKDAQAWVDLPRPVVDDTVPGRITFTFASLSGVAKVKVNGMEAFWLAAAFEQPFTPGALPPTITSITGVVATTPPPAAQLDAAFHNATKLDVSKPFFPFGRRPVYGDALYLASTTGFAPGNASVTLSFTLRPYAVADLQRQFANLPAGGMTIRTIARWQYLDTAGSWVDLRTYDHELTVSAAATPVFTPTSRDPVTGAEEGTLLGLSATDTSAVVSFAIPAGIGLHEVNGVESRWLRMLLVSDDPYGHEGVLRENAGPPTTYKFVGPLLIPPRLEGVSVTYAPDGVALPVERAATFNTFGWQVYDTPGAGFVPFPVVAAHAVGVTATYGASPAVYLGFDAPFERAALISLFVLLAGPESPFTAPMESGQPSVAWECWTAAGWRPLDVTDETLDLTSSGTVAFVALDDAAPRTLFEHLSASAAGDTVPRWWLRARLGGGRFDHPPRIRGIYVNTVMAENRVTAAELLVGSSNGEPLQEVALVRGPVLDGALWVREPDAPTEQELSALEAELESDGVPAGAAGTLRALDVRQAEGGEPAIWVRWRRVPNFALSGPRSRHYMLDAVAPRVIFGGLGRGLIPPPLRDNIVLRDLVTGGGMGANRENGPLAVKELKTSLSYVDRVFNVTAAAGGASEWTLGQLAEFGPHALKTRDRAVTTEDYEWLVLQRFSEVARARCMAVRVPGPGGSLVFKAGGATVLVIPRSTESRPQPTEGLIRKVREFLVGSTLANIGADVHVKGPDYVGVDITATLVPRQPELASVILGQAQAALEAFLHPLTGGEDGEGYGFGRPVHLSEVHAVLVRIEGVDHVVSAGFVGAPGADAFPVGADRIASSGTHALTVVAGEP